MFMARKNHVYEEVYEGEAESEEENEGTALNI